MSRILKHKRKFFIYLSGLVVCMILLKVLTRSIPITFFGFVLYLMATGLNELVCRKINRQRDLFGINSSIRNADYLIIGDYCDTKAYVPEGMTHIELFAPGRSYEAAFQILRHTHSILKEEGGTVIITIGKGQKSYTVFDIVFFHEITIKKYGLQRLKKISHFPLIAEPINSLKFLVERDKKNTYISTEDAPSELRSFCDERNYRLIFLKKV